MDIQQNIHESIYDIVRHMSVLIPPIPFQYEKSEKAAKYITDIGENPPDEFTDVRINCHKVIKKISIE